MEAGPRDSEETAVEDGQRPANGEHPANGGHPGRVGDLTSLGDRPRGTPDGDDGDDAADDPDGPSAATQTPEEPQELRPQRKLRAWQIAPIVGLGAIGSLMFAFPLAFEPGGGTGAVVSMLGLLICSCAAGWGVMAARRVGLTWPGLPAPGSGERTDWRVAALYALIVGTVVALAIWRVARLR